MSDYGGVRLLNEAAGELRGALADITWRKTDKRSIHQKRLNERGQFPISGDNY